MKRLFVFLGDVVIAVLALALAGLAIMYVVWPFASTYSSLQAGKPTGAFTHMFGEGNGPAYAGDIVGIGTTGIMVGGMIVILVEHGDTLLEYAIDRVTIMVGLPGRIWGKVRTINFSRRKRAAAETLPARDDAEDM